MPLTAELAMMAATMAAEGCLLNMPRKIGFEILIFPQRVSIALRPCPPKPSSLACAFYLYPRFSVSHDRSLSPVTPGRFNSRATGEYSTLVYVYVVYIYSTSELNTDVAIVTLTSLIVLNFYVMCT